MMDDVKGIFLSQIKAQALAGAKTFVLKNTSNFNLRESTGIENKEYKNAVTLSF